MRIWILVGRVLKIVKNLDKHDKKDLMAWLLTQSERTFQRSFENGQPYSSIKRAVRFNLEELKENISKARL